MRHARRLIGGDGLSLVTGHGTVVTPLDHDLAAGRTGLVPSPLTNPDPGEHRIDPTESLRYQVTRTWAALSDADRAHWLRAVGVPRPPIHVSWDALTGEVQTRIIGLYLDTHQPGQTSISFRAEPIVGDPRETAMRMFQHRHPLDATDIKTAATDNAPTVATTDSPGAAAAHADVRGHRLSS